MEDLGSTILREKKVILMKDMSEMDHHFQSKVAQKLKIKWSIEGD